MAAFLPPAKESPQGCSETPIKSRFIWRRSLLVAAACLSLAVLMWWWWPLEKQPTYSGKPILDYFPVWSKPPAPQAAGIPPIWVIRKSDTGTEELARAAGPEAIPWLLRVIRRADSGPARFYTKLWRRLPGWAQQRLPVLAWWPEAVHVLHRVAQKQPVDAAPLIVAALKDGTPNERHAAAGVAEQLCQSLSRSSRSPQARQALPALAVLQANTNALIRIEAIFAAWSIDSNDRRLGAKLVREFQTNNGSARFRAGNYLAQKGAFMNLDPQETISAMLPVLRGESATEKALAIRVLGHFGKGALFALPEFMMALKDGDRALRFAAVHAIEAIGPAARDAVPALIESLDDPQTQAVAARALGAFGSESAAGVPKLVELLADTATFNGSVELRSNAARTLGRTGMKTEAVTNALHRAAEDSEPAVRSAAEEALRQLDAIGTRAFR